MPMTVKLNPTKHLLSFRAFLFAASCVSLTAFVSAQAIPLRPPTIVSHGAQDKLNMRSTRDEVDNFTEERSPILAVSTQGTIEDATKTFLEVASPLTENKQRTAFQRMGANEVARDGMSKASTSVMKEKIPVEHDKHLAHISTHLKDTNNLELLVYASALKRKLPVAESIKTNMLKKWKKEGKTLDDVMDLLQFERNDMHLFERPLVDILISYAKMHKEDELDELNEMGELLKTLLTKFDEDVLATLLATAKASKPIAKSLENELLVRWKKQKMDIHNVFLLLKLDKLEIVDLLNDPKLNTWFLYVHLLDRNPYDLMISAMRKIKSDVVVNKVLAAARKPGGNEDLLVTLQFEMWKQEERSADDIFVYLKLDEEGDRMLESPSWRMWVSYLEYLGGNHDEIMLSKFKKFSDEILVEIIARGQSAENTRKFAEKVEYYLWMKNKITLERAFELLKLHTMGYKMFRSREFHRWYAYISEVNKKKNHPDKFIAIAKLQKLLGPKRLTSMLDAAENDAKLKMDEITLDNVRRLKRYRLEWERFLDGERKRLERERLEREKSVAERLV